MNIPSTTVTPYTWTQRTTTPPQAQPAVNPAASPPAAQPGLKPGAAPGQADTFEAAPAQNQFQPTFGAPPAPAAAPDAANVFGQAGTQKGNWATDTVPVKQTSDVDCGAAAATILSNAKSPLAGEGAQAQKMNDLQKQFGSDKGTTPEQMKKMLSHEGIQVRRTDPSLDNESLAGTLSMGGKTTALVDSNTIKPGGADKDGAAHWVVVDGMNEKGDYRVRDPNDGSSYYVSPEKLGTAMDTARAEHGSGGMMYVESAQASEQTLNQVGPDGSAVGKTPGTGSRSLKSGGESSIG